MRGLADRRWGYVAAAWAAAFAAVHFFWAAGGSIGLATSAGERLAAERPGWFVAGGLWGVGALLLVGVGLALGLAGARPHGWRGRVVVLAGAAAGIALLARAVVVEIALLTGALDANASIRPEQRHWTLVLWNPWFVVGGLAFGLAALGMARSRAGAG